MVHLQNSQSPLSDSRARVGGEGDHSASSSISSGRSGSIQSGFDHPNNENKVNLQEPEITTTWLHWSDALHHFVLNGLFRECKVIFQKEETEYGGPLYRRVLFQFKDGLADPKSRFDLNSYQPKDVVMDWWNKYGVNIIHKKLMEKKSNHMAEVRRLLRGKSELLFASS